MYADLDIKNNSSEKAQAICTLPRKTKLMVWCGMVQEFNGHFDLQGNIRTTLCPVAGQGRKGKQTRQLDYQLLRRT